MTEILIAGQDNAAVLIPFRDQTEQQLSLLAVQLYGLAGRMIQGYSGLGPVHIVRVIFVDLGGSVGQIASVLL